MNALSYANTTDFSFFALARNHLESMICHPDTASVQRHGVIEEYIRTEGNEVLRRLLQGYLARLSGKAIWINRRMKKSKLCPLPALTGSSAIMFDKRRHAP